MGGASGQFLSPLELGILSWALIMTRCTKRHKQVTTKHGPPWNDPDLGVCNCIPIFVSTDFLNYQPLYSRSVRFFKAKKSHICDLLSYWRNRIENLTNSVSLFDSLLLQHPSPQMNEESGPLVPMKEKVEFEN